jgi:methylase of polypeptide subunit release factors
MRYRVTESTAFICVLQMLQEELDRLDLFHHCLILRTDGKLHLAPIDPHPQRILDLGTGSGIWAIEMGKSII